MADAFARLPDTMRKTLTWDRGVEMTRGCVRIADDLLPSGRVGGVEDLEGRAR